MKTVVFGGSGFLGSHVCDQLSSAGHKVTIFDKVDSKWKQDCQELILCNLLDPVAVENAVVGADFVYNFAGIADLDEAIKRPVDTVQTNILGNVNVLEACRKQGVKRFVYASTVYVYSREGGFYRCSKQSAEHYVEEYQATFGLDYTILRYGSLYGPRSDETNGLYRIVLSALKNGRVIYEGDPESLREYIHVEDAAKASVTVLGEEFCNQHVVLTGRESMQVIDLMKMLAEILGLPETVEFVQGNFAGHYTRTPYAYLPKLGRKYTPPLHVDLGQGLLQLIDEVRSGL